MFGIVMLQICLLGQPTCAFLTDKLGPYTSIEKCELRIDSILNSASKTIPVYGYRAVCRELDQEGNPIGEWKLYIREGDSTEPPKLKIAV